MVCCSRLHTQAAIYSRAGQKWATIDVCAELWQSGGSRWPPASSALSNGLVWLAVRSCNVDLHNNSSRLQHMLPAGCSGWATYCYDRIVQISRRWNSWFVHVNHNLVLLCKTCDPVLSYINDENSSKRLMNESCKYSEWVCWYNVDTNYPSTFLLFDVFVYSLNILTLAEAICSSFLLEIRIRINK